MELIIIILGLVILLAILINPLIGLIMLVILFYQETLFPVINASIIITPLKVIGIFTFCVTIFKSIFKKVYLSFIIKKQIWFFVLFLICLYVSGFVHPNSFTRSYFTMFTSFAVFGIIILLLIDSISSFRLVLWFCILSAFVASSFSVFEYIKYKDMYLRIRGEAYGPNEFAISILPMISICYYGIRSERKKILKIVLFVSTIIIFFALILSFSRGGLVGLIVMLIAGFLKAKHKILVFVIGLIMFAVVASYLPSLVWERVEETKESISNLETTSSFDSTKRRYLLAKAAWEIFLEYPVTGIGLGNYYWECSKYEKIHPGRPRSTYLEILSELGLIGFMFFLGIIFYTLRGLGRIIKKTSDGYAEGFYFGIIGFLVAAIFLHAYHEKILWFLIFMSTALEVVMNNNLKQNVSLKENTAYG